MDKATFDHCCCCIELTTGCFIWAYLELVGSLYTLVKIIMLCVDVDSIIHALQPFIVDSKREEFEETEEVMKTTAYAMLIVISLIWAIKLFFSIVFLNGLHRENRSHVGAYLLYTFIFMVVGFIMYMVITIKLATLEFIKLPEVLIGICVFIAIIVHLMMVYFWMVIRSQYCNMEIRPNQQVVYRPK